MCINSARIVGFIPSGGTQTFDFKPVKGRYVNIFLPGQEKYLTLCEVQVFAGKVKESEIKCVHVLCFMFVFYVQKLFMYLLIFF